MSTFNFISNMVPLVWLDQESECGRRRRAQNSQIEKQKQTLSHLKQTLSHLILTRNPVNLKIVGEVLYVLLLF